MSHLRGSDNTVHVGSPDLIADLVRDLKNPTKADGWAVRFWSVWVVALFLNVAICFVFVQIWPTKLSLPTESPQASYWLAAALWLLAFSTCALVSFRLSIPLRSGLWPKRFAWLTFATLLIAILYRGHGLESFANSGDELTLARAKCGLLVALSGGIAGLVLLFQSRRALPTKSRQFGFWTLAASGCVGGFGIHAICHHDSAAHVLVWHVAPVFTLASIGWIIADRITASRSS